MAEFLSHDDDDRSVELSSIAAIYPEIVIDPASPYKASLELPVAPSNPLRVCFEQKSEPNFPVVLTPPTSVDTSETGSAVKGDFRPSTVDASKDVHLLSHLPPLNLDIELPERYPSEQPPMMVPAYGKKQCAESAFDLNDTPDDEAHFSRDLKIALLDFNNKAEREKFEQETFECGDFYNTCITEGDVDSVKCLAPDCSKEQQTSENEGKRSKKRAQTLSPSELLHIPLEQETVQRYVFLKRKKRLEADKTTIYCPRKWCQGAARSKKHPKPTDLMTDDFDVSDDEEGRPVFDPLGDEAQLPPVADRVAICEDCGYAFCSVCKKGWHGELVRCFPRREAELSAEEKATEEYLKKYTSPCPTCNAPCQKRMGCNHMICFKCATHFCYLCSSWLSEDNPYRHFNDLNSDCYNRLWDMEGGDGINPDGAEALHQIPNELLEFDDPVPHDQPVWGFGNNDNNNFNQGRQPPPPAPVPPGRAGNPQQGRNVNLDAAGRAAAAERQAQARAMAEVRGRPDQAAQPQQPRGLQRFLDLVQNDREDEWDSDELDDEF
ncbi:Ring finger protein [Aspergillus sclerotialis]|uniref:RBR-type E3 ubiquitin transferase n=1 Tax=Aspergillus sclerotialis TaxID=2070753 RepID=A0A3A2ZPN6_9EURO|nr:Ring finger protein [Aspergillus sclerotialis]